MCECVCHETQPSLCSPCCFSEKLSIKNLNDRLEQLENLMKNNIDIVQRIGVFKELSDRIEKLEKFINSIKESPKYDLKELIFPLEDRIKKLESMYQSDFENTKEVIFSLSEHKESIDELERWKIIAIERNLEDVKRMKELEVEIDTVRALGSRAYHPNKPHKCPVCEGKGFVFVMYSMLDSKTDKCNSCEGKGIVWG